MLKKQRGALSWLEFELFEDCPHLTHALFLRHGGVSEGPFSSLNVGLGLQDNDKHVHTNLQRITGTLSKRPLPLFIGEQVHGNKLAIVTGTGPHRVIGVDGLVTVRKQQALMVRHADCQAAIFYDPIKKLLAVVHSGWRGSVLNIYRETIRILTQTFSVRREDLLVGISPSLGPQSSEFLNYEKELPQSFLPFQVRPYYFDFWAISRAQLEAEGILPDHIQIAGIDTYTSPEDFFSYRREKVCGRNGTVAFLRDRSELKFTISEVFSSL